MLWRHWPEPGALRGQSRRAVAGFMQCDPLSEPAALARGARGMKALICLAGVTPAQAQATGDAMGLNTDLALAAIAAAPPCARVLVASSAAVYGAAEGTQSARNPGAPLSAYGLAKQAMEQAALARGGGRVCVLRIGNVAGADAVLGGWRAGFELDQWPSGQTPHRSYIGPRSFARVLHALCHAREVPQVINIAAPGVVAMGDLLDAAGLVWRPRAAGPDAIAQVSLDTGPLERLYPFAPNEGTAAEMVAQWREGQGGTN